MRIERTIYPPEQLTLNEWQRYIYKDKICHKCNKLGAYIHHDAFNIIWTHNGNCLNEYNWGERKSEEL